MLTVTERMMFRAKVRTVEEAIEDLRACLSDNDLRHEEVKRRSIAARNAIAELKRYMEDDLS